MGELTLSSQPQVLKLPPLLNFNTGLNSTINCRKERQEMFVIILIMIMMWVIAII